MIDSEVKRYREVVDRRYQIDEMKGSVEKIKVGNAIMPLDDFQYRDPKKGLRNTRTNWTAMMTEEA